MDYGTVMTGTQQMITLAFWALGFTGTFLGLIGFLVAGLKMKS